MPKVSSSQPISLSAPFTHAVVLTIPANDLVREPTLDTIAAYLVIFVSTAAGMRESNSTLLLALLSSCITALIKKFTNTFGHFIQI